ncbi:hypothetical protein NYR30_00440 [Gallibacterium salpingitidis]|uniref:hypothetical protein n=1 Tax=Gallibacterium salpingitidis TaxID=505341 RepID=UPI00266EC3AE|nr:hypothetical protein [Gallibacterium salpingitidis]WKS99802.1 hypothetical protein NYR30_00440 [Gallibacterium salpingitidis]
MYALDNQSGVEVMPPLKAQLKQPTNPLWFTEGGNGVAPSYPGADWFNVVQAELLNVLKAAQVTPSKDTLTQLASAVQKIAETAIAQSTKVDKGGDTMTGVLKAKDVLLTSDDGAVKSLSNVIQALSHLFTGNVQGFTDKMNALGTSGTTPLGITYNRDNPNAWYLCLGPLFGGFIIQGGLVDFNVVSNVIVTLPIVANKTLFALNAQVEGITDYAPELFYGWNTGGADNKTKIRFVTSSKLNYKDTQEWIAICVS